MEPKYFYLQILKYLFYQNKILQDGLCGHNVYICTLQDAYECGCGHDVQYMHMHDDVHEYVEFVSFETKILTSYD